jgi:endonuclease III
LTYEALKEKYPALPNYQTRPNEPNMNELIYKIGLLERRSSNLESVIINEESQS